MYVGDHCPWGAHIESWLSWLRAGDSPATTLEQRRYQLTRIARDFAGRCPWTLDVGDLADWLSSHSWARETLRSYRSALRSFYGWAHVTGMISSDPSRLLRRVPATMGVPRPAPESVITDALARSSDRVWLMIMLGSRHGLRRGEIAKVSTRDLRGRRGLRIGVAVGAWSRRTALLGG